MKSTNAPSKVRRLCRRGKLTGSTAEVAPGYVQANLCVVPAAAAADFRRFCRLNPQACPLLEETEPGDPEPRRLAPGADLRTDLPRYQVFHHGEPVAEVKDLREHWREDLVAFLLGCSFTFDAALRAGNLPVRHLEMGCNVPMYRTTLPVVPAGPFSGSLVVSMRPLTPEQTIRAKKISGRYPRAHGEPIHLGDPDRIGVSDLGEPDFGDPVPLGEREMPVFWACGVTSQEVLRAARLDLAITHSPGCMLVTNLRDEELAEPEGP